MSAPALTFLAPPSTDDGDTFDDAFDDTSTAMSPWASPSAHPPGRGPAPSGRPAPGLRMTRGAREAAAGMKVADADIQRCLDAPDDVSPDENTPSRTRFRRGRLVVLAAADGMVLRVDRRGR